MSLLEIYDLVLKDGLRFYKYKNSQLRSISSNIIRPRNRKKRFKDSSLVLFN